MFFWSSFGEDGKAEGGRRFKRRNDREASPGQLKRRNGEAKVVWIELSQATRRFLEERNYEDERRKTGESGIRGRRKILSEVKVEGGRLRYLSQYKVTIQYKVALMSVQSPAFHFYWGNTMTVRCRAPVNPALTAREPSSQPAIGLVRLLLRPQERREGKESRPEGMSSRRS